jgi:hypothetical protein
MNIILVVCIFHRSLKLHGLSCRLHLMSIDGDCGSDLFTVSVVHVCVDIYFRGRWIGGCMSLGVVH